MRSKLAITIIVILMLVCSTLFIIININKKPNSLKGIINYRIYYRKLDKSILSEMGKYDLNIVEGSFFDTDDVDFLHTNNSKVVGYYSVMEVGSWDTSFIEKLYDCDYLRIDKEKVLSKSEKNFIGDISQLHYQEVLISQIETRVIDKKMDGVFLDTVDWIDYYKNDTYLYNKLLSGYNNFLKTLKSKYPNLIIIQNRGFESYERVGYKYVDGILYENFSSPYLIANESKINMLEHLKKVTNKNNTVVFTISFDEGNESAKLSDKLGWIHLQSPMENRYSSWFIDTKSKDNT